MKLPIISVLVVLGLVLLGAFVYSKATSVVTYDRPYQYASLDQKVFEKLPKVPYDFEQTKMLFEAGRLDLNDISEDYYLQPEFYPTWKLTGIEIQSQGKLTGYTKAGATIYPSEYMIELPLSDGLYNGSFIVRSEFGSEPYQGIRFDYTFPKQVALTENRFENNEMEITQDQDYVKDKIWLSFDPKETTLEPAANYQTILWENNKVIGVSPIKNVFERGWAKKISFTMQTRNLKAGKYVVGVGLVSPSKEYSKRETKTYLTRYSDYGNIAGDVNIGFQFKILIWVH